MSDERQRQEAADIAAFETEGAEQVKLRLVSGGYPRTMRHSVHRWLAEKARGDFVHEHARQVAQAATVRRARARARVAAVGAVVAAMAVIIGAVVSYLAWFVARR